MPRCLQLPLHPGWRETRKSFLCVKKIVLKKIKRVALRKLVSVLNKTCSKKARVVVVVVA